MSQLSEDELFKEISQLREEINKLREEKRGYIEQLRSLRAKKNEKLERLRAIRTQVQTLREEYEKKKSELKQLKEKKQQLLNAINEIKKDFDELKSLLGSVGNNKKVPNPALIKKQIDELEWKIETNSLTLDEEKKIIQKIAALEAQLAKLLKIANLKQKSNENKAELLARRVELKSVNETIVKLAMELNEKRKLFLTLKQERDKLFNEIGELKKQIDELSNKIASLNSQISEKKNILNEKVRALKQLQEGKQKNAENTILAKKKKEVEEKLKTNKRLSFEEFLILYGNQENGNEKENSDIR
ncbi:MAG: hypothetical protein OWQ54_03600 [Sulfolobaceae archaeon]|nr:hypothetical protein [Sulfolobaceae archaeon]